SSLAESWRQDRENRETVIEVLAEAALRDGPRKISVRGGDDPHVDLLGTRATHAFELASLQDTQQLRLQLQRKLTDLVQEERSTVGELEAPGPRGRRAGEGALLVTEQLALDEQRRQRRAVHLHERAGPARTAVMNRAGQQLLARARLAKEQDG